MQINAKNDQERKECIKKIRGCLVGGAIGDALGYPIEFAGEEEIFHTYGKQGLREYILDAKTHKALISDDTQMTLFTANGLLYGNTRGDLRGIMGRPRSYVAKAYQDWLRTQEESYEEGKAHSREGKNACISWLADVPELYELRAPGNTCLSALKKQKNESNFIEDYISEPQNNSKGCGGIMRIAPFALAYPNHAQIDELDKEGAEIAAITHGHSLGYMPAAVVTHILSRIISSKDSMELKEIVLEAKKTVSGIFRGDEHLQELVDIIDLAVNLSENSSSDLDNIHQIGEGWVAEETLGIALYCSLRYQKDFSGGVIAAVNHKGDSDSTGAVTGNILGALLGYEAIEEKWKSSLELLDVIIELADDLCVGYPSEVNEGAEKENWLQKYLYGHRVVGPNQRLDALASEKIALQPGISCVQIQKISITDLCTDAIVNAANEQLLEGGGVCGAIFKQAGSKDLSKACQIIGFCKTGSAVITPGFNLSCKYIIHAVGPRWIDGEHGEPSQLYDAYKAALELAKQNGCHSIGFPLISSGIYNYPKDGAWRKALRACNHFLKNNPDYEMDIVFAILDDKLIALGERIKAEIEVEEKGDYIAERRVDIPELTEELDQATESFCRECILLISALTEDKELNAWCRQLSIYSKTEEHVELEKILKQDFFQRAYDDGIVIKNYREVIDQNNLNLKMVACPTKEWVATLSKQQIIAVIAYHFRTDHFVDDYLWNKSIPEGYMGILMQGYLDKCNKGNH